MDFRLSFEKQYTRLDEDSLIQICLDKIQVMTLSNIGFFQFIDVNTQSAESLVWSTKSFSTEEFTENHHYPSINPELITECLHRNEAIQYNQVEPLPSEFLTRDAPIPITNLLIVPIVYKGSIKAIIGIANKSSDFSDSDIYTATTIGQLAYDFYLQHKIHHEIEFMAYFDPLTKLPNRALLTDRMNQAIAKSQRSQSKVAVCYMDLDGFKPVNDRYGHHTGDKVLIEVGQRLHRELREDDTVSRLGGDEFVMILTDFHSMKELESILKRILDYIAKPFEIEGHALHLSASIGISIYPTDDSDPDTLLRHADQAMYQAKQAGKSGFRVYQKVVDSLLSNMRLVQDEFDDALTAHEQIEFYYQPQIELDSGQVTGFESLVRWQHPDKGLLRPTEFLPVIANLPSEFVLGKMAIKSALNQLELLTNNGVFSSISVNVSPQQIQETEFVHFLSDILKRYPKEYSSRLQLEVIEAAEIKDFKQANKVMQEISKLGVRFSLDDFGTGYSSLSHFQKLPIDTLKIDRGFVKNMLNNSDDLEIVDGILQLAKKFNRPVIAEGVESQEIAKILLSMGCKYGQGFGIGHPMKSHQVIDWLRDWNNQLKWQKLSQASNEEQGSSGINDVILNHMQWLKHIKKSINAGTPLTEVNETSCEFHAWSKQVGKSSYANDPNYAVVQKKHHDLHVKARQITQAIKEDNYLKVNTLLVELNGMSGDFITHLRKIDAK